MMKNKLMPLLAGVITLSVAATPLLVQAQANTSNQAVPTQNQKNHHGGKWAKLNLSDAQKAEMKKIHDETRSQMEAVLTADQQAKLKTMMENHRQQHSQAQKPQAGPRQGKQNFWASLNLTQEQQAKLKQIKEAKKARMQAVLTPAQKQQMEQMRQQRQQQRQNNG